ncbi:hypothetical protein [Streptomyces sp. BPSDS2]|nr:hypothetical protein [Streptomyces sp. BPSDS2]
MRKLPFLSAALVAAVSVGMASPAVAQLSRTSPNGKAIASTYSSNTVVKVHQLRSGYSHADYYRKASSSTQRHLWNKSGVNTMVASGGGSAIFKLRVCEWVKDNDDKCSGWTS